LFGSFQTATIAALTPGQVRHMPEIPR